MARLDASALEKLRAAVQACDKPWILAAYRHEPGKTLPASMEGTIGFLDWRLHGQVSRLIKYDRIKPRTLALVPSRDYLGKASLLVYFADDPSDGGEEIIRALRKLNATELCLAEDTWPAPLAGKLKQSLKKAGIQWTPLAGEP